MNQFAFVDHLLRQRRHICVAVQALQTDDLLTLLKCSSQAQQYINVVDTPFINIKCHVLLHEGWRLSQKQSLFKTHIFCQDSDNVLTIILTKAFTVLGLW